MLLGPVFQSEMVTTGRRARYFVLRVLFALALLVCLWGSYEAIRGFAPSGGLSIRDAANMASAFFVSFAWVTLIAAMLVTPAMAAGTIATERERRTIEYLFATDLSNAEIVFSKLVSRLLLAGKLIIVAVPILAIFRLMGGIPGNLLLTYFAGLGSTVMLLTTGALAISVWSPRARDAVIRVYLVFALIFFLPAFLGIPLSLVQGTTNPLMLGLGYLVSATLLINPLWVMGPTLLGGGQLGIGFNANPIWLMVAAHLVLSAILAGIAVMAVRRVHLRSVSSPGAAEPKRRRLRLRQYRPPLGSHPMVWKELFARTAGTKLGILGRGALFLIVLGMVGIASFAFYHALSSPNSWNTPGETFLGTSLITTVLLLTGTTLLMGIRAAGLITYEKERDCWLSLLSTPMPPREIIWGKGLGNLYAFRWLLLPMGYIWLMQAIAGPEYLLVLPFVLLSFATTGLFATALGLNYSLRFSTSLKAIGATMATLIFVGGGYVFCCCMPLFLGSGTGEAMGVVFCLCIPFLYAIPGMFAINSAGPVVASFTAGYVLGNLIYAVVGGLLISSLIARFDKLTGRSSTKDLYNPHSYAPEPKLPGQAS